MSAIVIWEKIEQFIAKNRSTAGLQNNNWSSGGNLRRENFDCFQQQFLRPIKHAKIVERPPAADIALRQCHPTSCGFKHFDSRNRGFRMKIVVESVRPKHDGLCLGARIFPRTMSAKPRTETLPRKRRNLPVRRDADYGLRNLAQPGSLSQKIRQRGKSRPKPRPAVNLPECVMIQRPPTPFVKMREKLSFVRGDIH